MIEKPIFKEVPEPKFIQLGNEIFCLASLAFSVLFHSLSLHDKELSLVLLFVMELHLLKDGKICTSILD